ncbi:MAG: PDZ domain-containing protein [Bacilli bacterium]|nr:PDZ domain-containing protein [Bacilli bacterium]
MHKIIQKTKNFIKDYYKTLIIYIVIFCIFTINLPFYISAPGGLIDTKSRIKTEDSFKLKGSLNMTYVSEIHATLPTYIWSFIAKDWDLEKEEDTVIGNESVEDMYNRNKLLLKESNTIAELVAYKYSNIDYEISNEKLYVTYIDENAKTNLKNNDQIIEIDGNKIPDKNYIFSYVASKNIGDKITLKVIRNKKKIEREATLIDIEGEPKVGIMITENFDIKSNKKVDFTFDSSESGPSGGLMSTLTIYSYLNKIDLTDGRKIAGTGTIDINGNVGQISGVKYKLIGAVNNKADVFIVPKGDNYNEAKKVKKERGFKIDIVPVETFEQALNYLSK